MPVVASGSRDAVWAASTDPVIGSGLGSVRKPFMLRPTILSLRRACSAKRLLIGSGTAFLGNAVQSPVSGPLRLRLPPRVGLVGLATEALSDRALEPLPMTARVEPRLPRGLRDWLPEYALARQRIVAQVTRVYERYGFVPLSTPAVEHIDVLTGSAGEEAQRSIFTATNPDEEALGLRFDLTVPLARVVSQYKELPRPFRRYQVSPVWRADKPGPGRFREFVQFDIDAVGVPSELADVEAIAALCDALDALGVGAFVVRVSSRGLLAAVMRYASVPDSATTDVLRVLDKLDKVGPRKVRLELTTGYKDESGDPIRGLGLASSSVDAIDRFLAIRADARDEVLAGLSSLLAGVPGADVEI